MGFGSFSSSLSVPVHSVVTPCPSIISKRKRMKSGMRRVFSGNLSVGCIKSVPFNGFKRNSSCKRAVLSPLIIPRNKQIRKLLLRRLFTPKAFKSTDLTSPLRTKAAIPLYQRLHGGKGFLLDQNEDKFDGHFERMTKEARNILTENCAEVNCVDKNCPDFLSTLQKIRTINGLDIEVEMVSDNLSDEVLNVLFNSSEMSEKRLQFIESSKITEPTEASKLLADNNTLKDSKKLTKNSNGGKKQKDKRKNVLKSKTVRTKKTNSLNFLQKKMGVYDILKTLKKNDPLYSDEMSCLSPFLSRNDETKLLSVESLKILGCTDGTADGSADGSARNIEQLPRNHLSFSQEGITEDHLYFPANDGDGGGYVSKNEIAVLTSPLVSKNVSEFLELLSGTNNLLERKFNRKLCTPIIQYPRICSKNNNYAPLPATPITCTTNPCSDNSLGNKNILNNVMACLN